MATKWIILSIIISCVVTYFSGRKLIPYLHKLKFGQSILIYVEKHKQKSGTATMGGIIFILSSFIGYFIFFSKHNTLATILMCSFLFFGVLGFLDDFIKIKYKQNKYYRTYKRSCDRRLRDNLSKTMLCINTNR